MKAYIPIVVGKLRAGSINRDYIVCSTEQKILMIYSRKLGFWVHIEDIGFLPQPIILSQDGNTLLLGDCWQLHQYKLGSLKLDETTTFIRSYELKSPLQNIALSRDGGAALCGCNDEVALIDLVHERIHSYCPVDDAPCKIIFHPTENGCALFQYAFDLYLWEFGSSSRIPVLRFGLEDFMSDIGIIEDKINVLCVDNIKAYDVERNGSFKELSVRPRPTNNIEVRHSCFVGSNGTTREHGLYPHREVPSDEWTGRSCLRSSVFAENGQEIMKVRVVAPPGQYEIDFIGEQHEESFATIQSRGRLELYDSKTQGIKLIAQFQERRPSSVPYFLIEHLPEEEAKFVRRIYSRGLTSPVRLGDNLFRLKAEGSCGWRVIIEPYEDKDQLEKGSGLIELAEKEWGDGLFEE